MLRPAAFFDSSQWVAERARDWPSRGVELEVSDDAHLALGLPQIVEADVHFPGANRVWRLSAECGLQVIVIQAFQVLSNQREQVLATQVVTPFRSEARHALQHLMFQSPVTHDQTIELRSGWELSRLDDNGQQFVIGVSPRRASADCVASLLSVGKHKQTYSVRLVEPLPLMVSDVGDWELWRRDDGGNAFLVTRHLTRGHAQMQLEALKAEPRHVTNRSTGSSTGPEMTMAEPIAEPRHQTSRTEGPTQAVFGFIAPALPPCLWASRSSSQMVSGLAM